MLFVGDDWAEGHHDIEIVDDGGKVLVRRRLPEGLEGITRLHALVAAQLPDDWVDRDPSEVAGLVKVGIETECRHRSRDPRCECLRRARDC